MTAKENKLLVRRLFEEAMNTGNLAVVDELVAPTFVSHTGPKATREGFKQGIITLHRLSPNLQYIIEDIFAQGSRVAVLVRAELTVHAPLPQGGDLLNIRRAFSTNEIHIFRLRKGKIVEHWVGTWKPL